MLLWTAERETIINKPNEITDKALDRLISEIIADADGEDEQLRAINTALADGIELPCNAFVIGEPVIVSGFNYDGNRRRGITARCRRPDGSEYPVSVCDVVLEQESRGARLIAACRRWMGLDPWPEQPGDSKQTGYQHTSAVSDIDLTGPVELVVLSVKDRAIPCRLMNSRQEITLRPKLMRDTVPGEIVVVKPFKQWTFKGHPYLSGEIESSHINTEALGLEPLKLEDRGLWTPEEHYWGEGEDPIGSWAKPIIAWGPRQTFEIEQIIPGGEPKGSDSNPIRKAINVRDTGDPAGARKILMELCQADLRCLDAHAHLGSFAFDDWPKEAVRHYEIGVRIGELSFDEDCIPVLPWSCLDNRPFLRCMHGFGLCLWRLERFGEAEQIFERMLWLNPTDNQGARFLLNDVRAEKSWKANKAQA